MEDESKLEVTDFDAFGTIRLSNKKGLIKIFGKDGFQELVTPDGNGHYISRAKVFWENLTCSEASKNRELLKTIVTKLPPKKAFVALDYMSNFSAKIYFENFCRRMKRPELVDFNIVETSKKCLLEDVSNIIALFEGKQVVPSTTVAPGGDEFIEERNIECNNMALLYLFTKAFDFDKNCGNDFVVLNPGLGSIFIGPFFNKIYGANWTNLIKSKYKKTNPSENFTFRQRIADPSVLRGKKVLVLDDNIGTGETIKEIIDELDAHSLKSLVGAVQFNWYNFKRVFTGEKDIPAFKPSDIDFLTQFTYQGHKVLDCAISVLCGNGLTPDFKSCNLGKVKNSGDAYIKFLEYCKYNQPYHPDIFELAIKGYEKSTESKFPLYYENKNGEILLNPSMKTTSKTLITKIDEMLLALPLKNPEGFENFNQIEEKEF